MLSINFLFASNYFWKCLRILFWKKHQYDTSYFSILFRFYHSFFSSSFFFFGHKYLFLKHPWSCRNDCNIFKIIKFIKRKLKIFIITNSIAIAQCMSTCKSECTSKMVVCYQLRSWWDFMRVDEKRGLRTTILRGRVCFILLYH